jgi:hypothetical protein
LKVSAFGWSLTARAAAVSKTVEGQVEEPVDAKKSDVRHVVKARYKTDDISTASHVTSGGARLRRRTQAITNADIDDGYRHGPQRPRHRVRNELTTDAKYGVEIWRLRQ